MPDPLNLEAMVEASTPGDRPDLSGLIHASDFAGAAPEVDPLAMPEAPLVLMTPEAFGEQWGLIHDMLGGMVTMRTGTPCPLGDQARSEGGRVAASAAYSLLASQPMLASLFLSPNSTFFGQAMVLGVHGFACVQIVKASREGVAAAPFVSQREA